MNTFDSPSAPLLLLHAGAGSLTSNPALHRERNDILRDIASRIGPLLNEA